MLVTTVTHDRLVEERRKARWVVGASITKMSEGERERPAVYLETRAQEEPAPLVD